MKIETDNGYFSIEAVKKNDEIECVLTTYIDGSKHLFRLWDSDSVEIVSNELLNILELMKKCSQKQK